MSATFGTGTVLDVPHCTDDYSSCTTTRDETFRSDNGQFVMLGLPPRKENARPVLRANSIASAHWEEQLEFFSIHVADGALTSRLRDLGPGDPILIGRKPTATLLLNDLHPGRNLYLLATGTGLAPWLPIKKDLETYDRFERVIVCHASATCTTLPTATISPKKCLVIHCSATCCATHCCDTPPRPERIASTPGAGTVVDCTTWWPADR